MDPVVILGAGLVGLAVGPLLGRITDRVPGRLPVLAEVEPAVLVPVLSWFGAAGRARGGGATRRRDPGIDLAAALTMALLVSAADTAAQAVGLGIAAAAFVVLAVIDLEHHRLPDIVVFPALGAVLGAATVGVMGGAPVQTLTGALVGAAAEFALFLIMAVVTPGWVGLGDVKLALLLGAVGGWVGASIATAPAGPIAVAVVVCMYGLLLGSVLAVVLGLVRGVGVRRRTGLRPDRSRPIVLVGPMGAGKSALGGWMAAVLGRPFVDLDASVADRAGRSVPEIFAAAGESEFRRMEAEALAEALRDRPAAVVATGGGAVLDPGSREQMRSGAGVVWLDAEVDELRRRVGSGSDRPLLHGDPDALRRLRAERETLYREVAHARLDTSALPEAEARRRLDQIVSGMLGYFPFGPPLLAGTVVAVVVARPLLG